MTDYEIIESVDDFYVQDITCGKEVIFSSKIYKKCNKELLLPPSLSSANKFFSKIVKDPRSNSIGELSSPILRGKYKIVSNLHKDSIFVNVSKRGKVISVNDSESYYYRSLYELVYDIFSPSSFTILCFILAYKACSVIFNSDKIHIGRMLVVNNNCNSDIPVLTTETT